MATASCVVVRINSAFASLLFLRQFFRLLCLFPQILLYGLEVTFRLRRKPVVCGRLFVGFRFFVLAPIIHAL